MQRGYALLAVILLIAAILPACSFRKAGAEGQIVLNPTDDTFVDDYSPQSNFGAQDAVKLSSYQPSFLWYHTDIWLKFDLSSIPPDATVDSATVQLYAVNLTDPYNHTWAYSCTNSSWSESTLTFQDYQDHLIGDMNFTLMSDIPVPSSSQWYNWSVNGAVVNALSQGRENVTLVLMVGNGEIHEASSYVKFSSKESLLGMAFAPRLIVHWSSAPSGVEGIQLEPKTATNHVGTSHTLRAFVTDKDGVPVPLVYVNFTIVSGPNAVRSMLGLSDANGMAAFSWSSGVSGTDIVNATIAGETVFDTASKTWESGFFDPIMDTINRIPIGVIVGTALVTIALVGSYAVLRWKRKTH